MFLLRVVELVEVDDSRPRTGCCRIWQLYSFVFIGNVLTPGITAISDYSRARTTRTAKALNFLAKIDFQTSMCFNTMSVGVSTLCQSTNLIVSNIFSGLSRLVIRARE